MLAHGCVSLYLTDLNTPSVVSLFYLNLRTSLIRYEHQNESISLVYDQNFNLQSSNGSVEIHLSVLSRFIYSCQKMTLFSKFCSFIVIKQSIQNANFCIKKDFYSQSCEISKMLLPYLSALNKKKIILGSQSKTRNQLFTTQKIQYEKVSSTFAEDLDKSSFACSADYNLQTCRGKVKQLTERFEKENKQWDVLICGDTIVESNGKIIEKPVDVKDCVEMMSSLSNKTHELYTAHIILFNTKPKILYEWIGKAEVTFGNIPIETLQEYAKTDQPYIHSGGYQLTAVSGSFIKEVKGSHTLIEGLDMYEVSKKLIEGAKEAKWI